MATTGRFRDLRPKDATPSSTQERLISDLQRDFGMSREDAAAFVGNFHAETGGFKQMQEVKPLVKGSKGGFGWAQWTGPRRKAFEASLAPGADPLSYEANYNYLKSELSGPFAGVVAKVKAAPDLQSKTKVVLKEFEAPKKKGMGVVRLRTKLAQQYAGAGPTPPGDIPAGTLDREAIAELQNFLRSTVDQSVKVDGIYGPRTTAAVKMIQEMTGAQRQDGVIDTSTLVAIRNMGQTMAIPGVGVEKMAAAIPPASKAPAANPNRTRLSPEVQQMLQGLQEQRDRMDANPPIPRAKQGPLEPRPRMNPTPPAGPATREIPAQTNERDFSNLLNERAAHGIPDSMPNNGSIPGEVWGFNESLRRTRNDLEPIMSRVVASPVRMGAAGPNINRGNTPGATQELRDRLGEPTAYVRPPPNPLRPRSANPTEAKRFAPENRVFESTANAPARTLASPLPQAVSKRQKSPGESFMEGWSNTSNFAPMATRKSDPFDLLTRATGPVRVSPPKVAASRLSTGTPMTPSGMNRGLTQAQAFDIRDRADSAGLDALMAKTVAPAPVPRSRPTVSRSYDAGVAAMQKDLASRGFNPGPIDGIMGRRTQAALDASRGGGKAKTPAPAPRSTGTKTRVATKPRSSFQKSFASQDASATQRARMR